jgi:putative ABC transport system ATP-binding protein
LHRKFNKTIVMVTHDPAAAQQAEIIRRLDKGQLLADGATGPFR